MRSYVDFFAARVNYFVFSVSSGDQNGSGRFVAIAAEEEDLDDEITRQSAELAREWGDQFRIDFAEEYREIRFVTLDADKVAFLMWLLQGFEFRDELPDDDGTLPFNIKEMQQSMIETESPGTK